MKDFFKKQLQEYFKGLVTFLTLNGVAWVWCSYALAYLGRDKIAESLSEVAIKEIIAVVLAYALKSLCENLSKYNEWAPKKKEPEEEEETV